MRTLVLLVSTAAAAPSASACSDATGTVTGGQALLNNDDAAVDAAGAPDATPCVPAGDPPRWQDLYACYFGPGGMASCGSSTCHSIATDTGALASSFVCGTSADSCFQGMTAPANGALAIVPRGGTPNPATAPLWAALHVSNPVGIAGNNMPLAPPYTFTLEDLTNIGAWIENGAQNN